MKENIELVELYIPDCFRNNPFGSTNQPELKGFHFVQNFGTCSENGFNFEQKLSQYFFENAHEPIPHGALCAYFLNLNSENTHWMKADPVQYVLDMNQGYMIPGEIQSGNKTHVIDSLNHFLSEDGLIFYPIDHINGLIGCDKNREYNAPSLVDMIHRSVSFDEFTGQDKSYVQKLNAELQLLFNQHKVQENDPDGLYFWGAGVLPSTKPTPKFNCVLSNDYSALGLAKLADIHAEKWDPNKSLNFDLIQEKTILMLTQDFTIHWKTGNQEEYIKLSFYFDKIVQDLISRVKNKTLQKIILHAGDKTYQLTKSNIIKSYFTRFFKNKFKY